MDRSTEIDCASVCRTPNPNPTLDSTLRSPKLAVGDGPCDSARTPSSTLLSPSQNRRIYLSNPAPLPKGRISPLFLTAGQLPSLHRPSLGLLAHSHDDASHFPLWIHSSGFGIDRSIDWPIQTQASTPPTAVAARPQSFAPPSFAYVDRFGRSASQAQRSCMSSLSLSPPASPPHTHARSHALLAACHVGLWIRGSSGQGSVELIDRLNQLILRLRTHTHRGAPNLSQSNPIKQASRSHGGRDDDDCGCGCHHRWVRTTVRACV